MIIFDTETCGFHGPIVLIQYLQAPKANKEFLNNDDNIILWCPWKKPIQETITLLESFTKDPEGVMGFNLVFDWFHVCQMLTVLYLMNDKTKILGDCIDEYYEKEPLGRDGPCIKPCNALDLMLHARKGPYQSTMERKDIVIKKIPTPLAAELVKELNKRIKLKDIYFARGKGIIEKWKIKDLDMTPDFKNIVLKFKASSALKALAADALQIPKEQILTFLQHEEGLSHPLEFGFAPYGSAVDDAIKTKLCLPKTSKKGFHSWKRHIWQHISHWSYNDLARRYARDDVRYTRDLWYYFGSPEFGDDDSILTCMVAASRWRGYAVDINKLIELKLSEQDNQFLKNDKGEYVYDTMGYRCEIPKAPKAVKQWIEEVMSPVEAIKFESTAKIVLETISKWTHPEDDTKEHPAAKRSKIVLEARKSKKKEEIYNKLILAGRLHASFKIIGALSGRMSGSDKLSVHGINKEKKVRNCFPLAHENEVLNGGDFSGFEVTLAEACYNDPGLRKKLLTCDICQGPMIHVPYLLSIQEWLKNDKEKLILYKNHRIKTIVKDMKKKGVAEETINTKEIKQKVIKEIVGEDILCLDCGSNEGKKIHGLFGVYLFPPMTYEEIVATSGTTDDKYTRSKSGVFAVMYGGEGFTLEKKLGVPIEIADKAVILFGEEFPGVGKYRAKIYEDHLALRQPGGIGSKVFWKNPKDKIESMFGFPRFFILEYQICRALFELAQDPPKLWQHIKLQVIRRDRVQTASGAVQSSLYASAFGIQSGITRAANNHVIQSSGAQITKDVQCSIWQLQPPGVYNWRVQPMNIHDEIMCPTDPNYSDSVSKIVKEKVETYRPKVPLIKIDWVNNLGSWADK